jgi:hypothetical protein
MDIDAVSVANVVAVLSLLASIVVLVQSSRNELNPVAVTFWAKRLEAYLELHQQCQQLRSATGNHDRTAEDMARRNLRQTLNANRPLLSKKLIEAVERERESSGSSFSELIAHSELVAEVGEILRDEPRVLDASLALDRIHRRWGERVVGWLRGEAPRTPDGPSLRSSNEDEMT